MASRRIRTCQAENTRLEVYRATKTADIPRVSWILRRRIQPVTGERGPKRLPEIIEGIVAEQFGIATGPVQFRVPCET
jgi:hypothetical protein